MDTPRCAGEGADIIERHQIAYLDALRVLHRVPVLAFGRASGFGRLDGDSPIANGIYRFNGSLPELREAAISAQAALAGRRLTWALYPSDYHPERRALLEGIFQTPAEDLVGMRRSSGSEAIPSATKAAIKVRPVRTAEDAATWSAIQSDAYRLAADTRATWPIRGPATRAASALQAFLGSLDGTAVAAAVVCRSADGAHLSDLALRSAFRGRGLGAAVVKALIHRPEFAATGDWTLVTTPAIAPFFRKVGFADGWIDSCILEV